MSYDEAVKAFGNRSTPAKDRDAAEMAWFCDTALQLLVGAVSPKLVWQGAQAKGMTAKDLMKLAATDAMAVSDLQWL